MATAAVGEGAKIGPSERISTMTQVRGAIGLMRGGGWPLLALWVAQGVANTAVTVAAGQAVNPQSPAGTWGYMVYSVAIAVLGAVAATVAMRLMLEGPRRWLRLDRRFLECAAILAASTAASSAGSALITMNPQDAEADPGGFLLRTLLVLGGYLGFLYAWLKLTLWPIGRLMGRPEVTPPRSWRLMRKATRGLVLGYVIFGMPIGVVALVAMPAFNAAKAWTLGPSSIAMNFASAAFSIAVYGLAAAIYRIRVAAPASVADVFE